MNVGNGTDAGNATNTGNVDAGGAVEAGSSACADAGPTGASGSMIAHEASSAIVVDGDLSDWTCAQFFTLDGTNAAKKSGTVASSVAIALLWTKSTLYFAANVTDPAVAGTDTNEPYKNDAIELYLGGGTPMGKFGTGDWQFVVDHKNFARAYVGTSEQAPPAGFASAAKRTSSGYAVEISVDASLLAPASLAAGASLGFDVQLDDCAMDGGDRAGYLIYWMASGASACTSCCSTEPSCNTLSFGRVTLIAP
jgi:hypothetical protein